MSQQSPKIDGLAPPASRTLKILCQLIIAVALLAGGGAAGYYFGIYSANYQNAQDQLYRRQHPEKAPERMAQRIASEVGLSAKQQEQVTQILKAHYPRSQQILQEIYPQMQQELDNIQLEIKPLLSDEQYAKLDKFFDDRLRTWAPTTQPPSRPSSAATATAPRS
jgi:uncharacterized protein HemX